MINWLAESPLGDGSVEVLVFQLAYLAAIHRVGPLGAEALHVELVRALAYLLVGVESYAYGAVLDFRVFLKVSHGADDFGNARLVVGAEQRGAVGHNQVLTFVAEQFGELLGRQHDAVFGIEGDDGAVVVTHNPRLDVQTGHVGRCVEVSDKTDSRHMLALNIAGEGSHEVAVIIESDVLEVHGLQLVAQMACKHHLPRRGRRHVGELVALRIVLDVVKKSVYEGHLY